MAGCCAVNRDYFPLKLHWFLLFLGTTGTNSIWLNVSPFFRLPISGLVGLEEFVFALFVFGVVVGGCAVADKFGRHSTILLISLWVSAGVSLLVFAVPDIGRGETIIPYFKHYRHPNIRETLTGGNFTCAPEGLTFNICETDDIRIQKYYLRNRSYSFSEFSVAVGDIYIDYCRLYCNLDPFFVQPPPCKTANCYQSFVNNNTDNEVNDKELWAIENFKFMNSFTSNCHKYQAQDLSKSGIDTDVSELNCTKTYLCEDCCFLGCNAKQISPLSHLMETGTFWILTIWYMVEFLTYRLCLPLSVDVTKQSLNPDDRVLFTRQALWSAVGTFVGVLFVFFTARRKPKSGTPGQLSYTGHGSFAVTDTMYGRNWDWTLGIAFGVLFRAFTWVNAKFYIRWKNPSSTDFGTDLLSFFKNRTFLFVLASAFTAGFFDGLYSSSYIWVYPSEEYIEDLFLFLLFVIGCSVSPRIIRRFSSITLLPVLVAIQVICIATFTFCVFFTWGYGIPLLIGRSILGFLQAVIISALVQHYPVSPGTSATAYALLFGLFAHIGPTLRLLMIHALGSFNAFYDDVLDAKLFGIAGPVMATVFSAYLGLYFVLFKSSLADGLIPKHEPLHHTESSRSQESNT